MPISADPNETVEYVLQLDAAKPKPPKAYLRFLTARQLTHINQLVKQASEQPDDEQAKPILNEILATGIARVEGYPSGADLKELDGVLTVNEMWELVTAIQVKPMMEELDRKKRLSPATSDAAAAGASEATTSRSSSPATAAGSNGASDAKAGDTSASPAIPRRSSRPTSAKP